MDKQIKWRASFVTDLGCIVPVSTTSKRQPRVYSETSLTNGWPHPEHPTVASELERDPFHERMLIYSELNQSNLANLGCIVRAYNPLSRTILGCVVTNPRLRLGEEHDYRAGIPRKSHPFNK